MILYVLSVTYLAFIVLLSLFILEMSSYFVDPAYWLHYADLIMSVMASQITSLMSVHSTVYSGAGQRKHQSSASRAFVRGIHGWPSMTSNQPHVFNSLKVTAANHYICFAGWIKKHLYCVDNTFLAHRRIQACWKGNAQFHAGAHLVILPCYISQYVSYCRTYEY